jgi:hypothetical protein
MLSSMNDEERRVAAQTLNRQSGPGGPTTEHLRRIQESMRRSFGEDVH